MARRSASGQRTPVADRGDIYLVSLDPTQGHEQQGRRPVLVVSPGAFNRLTRVPIVLPITTGGNFARVRGFTVSLTDAGTRTTGLFGATSRAPSTLRRAAGEGMRPRQQRSSMGVGLARTSVRLAGSGKSPPAVPVRHPGRNEAESRDPETIDAPG